MTQGEHWERVLDAWHAFERQVQNVHAATSADGDEVIRAVIDAITALNMVVSTGWVSPFTEEFNAWNQVLVADTSLDSLHAAATTVAVAGDRLLGQWHHEIDRANADSHDLTPAQNQFVTACGHARGQLAPATSSKP